MVKLGILKDPLIWTADGRAVGISALVPCQIRIGASFSGPLQCGPTYEEIDMYQVVSGSQSMEKPLEFPPNFILVAQVV